MVEAFYRYTNKKYAEWLEKQKIDFQKVHGLKLNGVDAENILVEKVLIPNQIKLSDTIKPIDINVRWKKLRLKL